MGLCEMRGEIAKSHSSVIASEAKQSIPLREERKKAWIASSLRASQ
jgi:hypothetical protein